MEFELNTPKKTKAQKNKATTCKPAQSDPNNSNNPGGTIGGHSTNTVTPVPEKIYHHILESEAKELFASLTDRQAKYCLARLMDGVWSFAKCSRVAGYSVRSSTQAGTVNEKNSHIARVLAVAKTNRSGGTSEARSLAEFDRAAAVAFYSQLADDVEYAPKVRMDAVKALRELEAWDKKTGNVTNVNILSVIMNEIDGAHGVLPGRAAAEICTELAQMVEFEAEPPRNQRGIQSEPAPAAGEEGGASPESHITPSP